MIFAINDYITEQIALFIDLTGPRAREKKSLGLVGKL